MLLDKDYIERLNGLPIGQVAGALGLEVQYVCEQFGIDI